VKIETPMGMEPCQVSVSPSGHVWILCWSGQILARSGVTWDCEMGTSWLEVSAPFNGVTFSHISVGSQAAWVVSRENEVWLRKGLDTTVIGSNWTSMIGAMNLVFTGSDNQVCGLLVQDQKLYLRTGIKPEEPGGRTWKMLPSDEETFTWIAFDGKGFVLRLEDTADSSWTEPWRYISYFFIHFLDVTIKIVFDVEGEYWISCVNGNDSGQTLNISSITPL